MPERAGFKIEPIPAQMPLQPFTRFKAVCGCGWESHVCTWAQAAKTLGERHIEREHADEHEREAYRLDNQIDAVLGLLETRDRESE